MNDKLYKISHRKLSLSLKILNLNDYIDENRSTLKPPVSNKLMFDSSRLKIMIVGGPNQRDDYHIEKGEELFFQLQGNMDLDIMDNNKFKRIRISQGEMFVLPPCIPHSPQRYANSIGLVFERVRYKEEYDALRWYIPNSNNILYEEIFTCTDLGTQLKPIIERYQQSTEYSTKTTTKNIISSNKFERDINLQKYNLPFVFNEKINEINNNNPSDIIQSYEYVVELWTGQLSKSIKFYNGDIFFYQLNGQSEIMVKENNERSSFLLNNGQVAVLSSSELQNIEINIKQNFESNKLITIYNKATN